MDQEKASKLMKQKLEALERENLALKKSLFELSSRYNSIAHKLEPFKLGDVLDTAMDLGITPLLENPENESTDSYVVNPREKRDNKLFNLKQDLKVLRLIQGHIGAVYAVEFSPCGRYLASGSFDKTARIWDYANQKEVDQVDLDSLS